MPYSTLKTSVLAVVCSALALLLGSHVAARLTTDAFGSALVYDQVGSVVIIAVLTAGCAAAAWWALSAWILLALMLPVASRERREHWARSVRVFVPRAMRPIIVAGTGVGMVLGSLPAAAVEEVPTPPVASQSFTLTMSAPVSGEEASTAVLEPSDDTAAISPDVTAGKVTVELDDDTVAVDDHSTSAPQPEPEQPEEPVDVPAPTPTFSLTFNEPSQQKQPDSTASESQESSSSQEGSNSPTSVPAKAAEATEPRAEPQEISATSPSSQNSVQIPSPQAVRATTQTGETFIKPAIPETQEAAGKQGLVGNQSPEQAAHYTVKAGDSLWKIAADQLPAHASNRDVAQRWQEIFELNREALGDDPNLIHPGTTLALN